MYFQETEHIHSIQTFKVLKEIHLFDICADSNEYNLDVINL